MAKDNVNYAGPGATVGIQAGTVVIKGGLQVGKDGVELGDVTAVDGDE
jgi:hypothetical protein